MDEEELEKLAVEEILKETKRGAERAKEHGALGWQKCPLPATNKRFLKNMLVGTLRNLGDKRHRSNDNYSFKDRDRGRRKRRNSDYDRDYEERSVRNYRDSSKHGSSKKRRHESVDNEKHHGKTKHGSKHKKEGEKTKKHKSRKKSSKKHKKKDSEKSKS